MRSPYWPLFDLRLRTTDLLLRPLCEDDLVPLAAVLPADVELNPAAASYDLVDPHVGRGIVVHTDYWQAYGTWRVEAWRLKFAVLLGSRLIGTQELEGSDFLRLRTVDTSAFLVPDVRGRGYGKQMRRAVLALAFESLNAQAAITSAWQDNSASLGVSRALGYQPNGEHLQARGEGADVMVQLRLRRADWLASDMGREVTVDGFQPCRHLFGLPAE